MGSSNLHIYLHFIWHTKDRRPVLRGELERFVHRRIREIAVEQRLGLLAINSAWNHVHALVRWNATSSIRGAVQRWKGLTSREWRPRTTRDDGLSWQRGYGAFSIHREQVPALKSYIGRQKHHHRRGTTIDGYERR